jgi:hypothetical protein
VGKGNQKAPLHGQTQHLEMGITLQPRPAIATATYVQGGPHAPELLHVFHSSLLHSDISYRPYLQGFIQAPVLSSQSPKKEISNSKTAKKKLHFSPIRALSVDSHSASGHVPPSSDQPICFSGQEQHGNEETKDESHKKKETKKQRNKMSAGGVFFFPGPLSSGSDGRPKSC